MKVKNNLLKSIDENIEYIESPNKSGQSKPFYLVIHYTAGTNLNGTISWFKNSKSKVSAHLIIDRDGKIIQMVPFNKKAWHAGKSNWNDFTSLNKYSIGIELVNAGKLYRNDENKWFNWANKKIENKYVLKATHKNENNEAGWQTYSEKQIEKLIEVSKTLNEKYKFLDILGHDDISPTRKVDPGPAFPMLSFKSLVLGRE